MPPFKRAGARLTHLFDLGLKVPQLETLFQPLVSLLRIELQFMLLLMEKLQQFLHLSCQVNVFFTD